MEPEPPTTCPRGMGIGAAVQMRLRRGHETPVELRRADRGADRRRDVDEGMRSIGPASIRATRIARIFGQAAGEHASRRARPDNHIIKHILLRARSFAWAIPRLKPPPAQRSEHSSAHYGHPSRTLSFDRGTERSPGRCHGLAIMARHCQMRAASWPILDPRPPFMMIKLNEIFEARGRADSREWHARAPVRARAGGIPGELPGARTRSARL